MVFDFKSNMNLAGGSIGVRTEFNEHQEVQPFSPPVLASQLHGCLHVVIAVHWRKDDRDADAHYECLLTRGVGWPGTVLWSAVVCCALLCVPYVIRVLLGRTKQSMIWS